MFNIRLSKKPSLEEQMAQMQKQIEILKAENKQQSQSFLNRLFPTPKAKKKIHSFPQGYVRVIDDKSGEYMILNEYGEKIPEDYQYLMNSPSHTHLEAAKKIREESGGKEPTDPLNVQGQTPVESFGDYWQGELGDLRSKISESRKHQAYEE